MKVENLFAEVVRFSFYIGLALAIVGFVLGLMHATSYGLLILTFSPLLGLAAALLKADRITKILITLVLLELLAAFYLSFH